MRKVEDCINHKLESLYGDVVFLVIGRLDNHVIDQYENEGWKVGLVPSLRNILHIFTNDPSLDIDTVKNFDFVVYSPIS